MLFEDNIITVPREFQLDNFIFILVSRKNEMSSTSAAVAKIPKRAAEVLNFWFGSEILAHQGPHVPGSMMRKAWFMKDPAFDQSIRDTFAPELNDDWAPSFDGDDSPLSRLAAILVLDQFRRNCFRDSPRAFARDGEALALAESLRSEGLLDNAATLSAPMRLFAALPFEHSEDLAAQQTCMKLMTQLAEQAQRDHDDGGYKGLVEFARKHLVIIEKFGRFPHRNETLGRESTAEEIAHVKEHGGF
jgi:uncharacterized protein (DUF924 family)